LQVNGGSLPPKVLPFCIGGALLGASLPLLSAFLEKRVDQLETSPSPSPRQLKSVSHHLLNKRPLMQQKTLNAAKHPQYGKTPSIQQDTLNKALSLRQDTLDAAKNPTCSETLNMAHHRQSSKTPPIRHSTLITVRQNTLNAAKKPLKYP
jgi:hypothetical protein